MAKVTQFLRKAKDSSQSRALTVLAVGGMILSGIVFVATLGEWYRLGDVVVPGLDTRGGSALLLLAVFSAGTFAGIVFQVAPESGRLLGFLAILESICMCLCPFLPFLSASPRWKRIGPEWEAAVIVALVCSGLLLVSSFICFFKSKRVLKEP